MSRVAWVDDEPALLVSYCLTHTLRGWGIVVKGRRTKTVDRVAAINSKLPDRRVGRIWLSMILVPQTAAVIWGGLCSSACLSFDLTLFVIDMEYV